MKWLMLAGLVTSLSGCGGYIQFIDGLNERQIQSCLRYNGTTRVGTLYGGEGALRGITATGGASVADCRELLGE